MNLDLKRISVIILTLLLGGVSAFILKEQPFADIVNWVIAFIFLFSSLLMYMQEVVRIVKEMLSPEMQKVHEKITDISENFNSTIKTLTFFYNSNKKERVRLSNLFSEESEEVSSGEIEMRTVPNFLTDRSSSMIVMEGRENSILKSHFHDRDVTVFVIDGKINIQTNEMNRDLNNGDSYEIKSGLRRKIEFLEESTVILSYHPPLTKIGKLSE